MSEIITLAPHLIFQNMEKDEVANSVEYKSRSPGLELELKSGNKEIYKWLHQVISSKPVRISDLSQLEEPTPIASNDPIDKNDPA